jgi:hypothetical protein
MAESCVKKTEESSGKGTQLCGLCGYLNRLVGPGVCAACGADHGHLAPLDEAAARALPPAAERLLEWAGDALAALGRVPDGFIRDLVRRRVEKRVREQGGAAVDRAAFEAKLEMWTQASVMVASALPWEAGAWARIGRVPESVRGMVIKEVEREAERRGETTVTDVAIDAALRRWGAQRAFHSQGTE